MVTPFDERDEVVLHATEAMVERLIEPELTVSWSWEHRRVLLSSNNDERRRFAEALAKIVAGRVPLLIEVGASGTKEAVELARRAEGVGANVVLSVSPYYWMVWEEAPSKYFATVSQSGDVPILAYSSRC